MQGMGSIGPVHKNASIYVHIPGDRFSESHEGYRFYQLTPSLDLSSDRKFAPGEFQRS